MEQNFRGVFMAEDIEVIQFASNDPDIDSIGELYCMTFLGEKYSVEDKQNAIKNIQKHARYEGFKGVKARDRDGNIVGFAYGYTSLPGQFYREKVEAQLSVEQINTWLGDCFEFVELAVSPAFRRLGIANTLHDVLLNGVNHRTALLTTGIDNSPAISFYEKKGWEAIKANAPVISEGHLQLIMGKELKNAL
jgi:ribosomal protein S18 acetylase RimI-like enzyme